MCSANGDVRFGSKADMCSAQAHVLFTPDSDIKCDTMECPLRAKSRHLHSSDVPLVKSCLRTTMHRQAVIGLIGGMSWESSAEYYRIINREVRRRLGGVHSARTLMFSV